jgi:riboflavin biosynthesis pyrimidine reductase
MRSLLPEPADAVDLVEAYAPPPSTSEPGAAGGRRFVRCNMISTFDGAISLFGRSGKLGGPADRRVFQVLRSWADLVVVGAGTARTERYGPVRLDGELRQRRRSRGQEPVPPIAVVTRSGDLDWSSPFFTDASARPIVVTHAAPGEDFLRRSRQVADVVMAGEGEVDLSLAFGELSQKGYRSVLLEGGPGLNADVVSAGLLDELCLTLSPCLVAGSGPRLFAGPELDPPMQVDVLSLLEEDGFFFWRLAVAPERGPIEVPT